MTNCLKFFFGLGVCNCVVALLQLVEKVNEYHLTGIGLALIAMITIIIIIVQRLRSKSDGEIENCTEIS